MKLRTKDGWYVFKIHGVLFVSWVTDKQYAEDFSRGIDSWIKLIKDTTGKDVYPE